MMAFARVVSCSVDTGGLCAVGGIASFGGLCLSKWCIPILFSPASEV